MKSRLRAKTVKISGLKKKQIEEMFHLFDLFYDDVVFERFKADLKNKSRVILLFDRQKKIKGFSTLDEFDLPLSGKNFRILYSGDTIISPEHWGTSVLTMAFLKYMIGLKMRYPFRPVWWFLISKGYKTYLLLANNFLNYYPHYNRETPSEYKQLLRELSNRLYPGKFNSERGIIEFEMGEHERLKETVAPITEELKKKYPKIKFFEDCNPHWRIGQELSCIGEVDPKLAITHPIKLLKKMISRSKVKTRNKEK